MSSEPPEERAVSADVPEPVARWLEGQALEADATPDEILRRLLVATHSVIEGEDGPDANGDALAEDLRPLREELDEFENAYQDDLADVRERVVEVKLDADEKAAADHDHGELRADVERAIEAVESVQDGVADLRADLDAGFENYEEILTYLIETTDELESKVETLTQTLAGTRQWTQTVTTREANRAAAAALARRANRRGIRTAQCSECGETVDVALLSAPECPFCASTFGDLEANTGITNAFTSSVLVAGDPPALPDAPTTDVGVEDISDTEDRRDG